MMKCYNCNGTGEYIYFAELDRNANFVTLKKRKGVCDVCNGSGRKPLTNADRIRAMSDEELAGFLCGVYDDEDEYGAKIICGVIIPCYDEYSIKEWLQQPAEGV